MKQREFKGEITVFLSLIFVLLLSLIGCLLQSASIHITKSMKRADTQLALESVFAEYETKMLNEYDVFVKLDSDEQKLSRRLWFYGAKNMEHKIQKIKLLTDSNGQAFFEQAVRSMGGEVPEVKTISNVKWHEEEVRVNQELDTLLQENKVSLPTESNPLEVTKRIKESDLLTLILPNSQSLSNRYVFLGELPSYRTLKQGTEQYRNVSMEGLTQKALFVEYLIRHFSDYTTNDVDNSLFYELEYLLEGKGSDKENLEAVLKKILTVRTGVNYVYLLTDQTKQAEAETMAVALCSAIPVPGVSVAVKQAILFAWAYGESIQDLRVLAKGERVAIVKTRENWQLDLDGLLKLGTAEETTKQIESENGMSYSDYVKVFLATDKTENLCMRALDLMELKTGIKVDGCVTAVQMKSTLEMQRNIKDTFITEYYYR